MAYVMCQDKKHVNKHVMVIAKTTVIITGKQRISRIMAIIGKGTQIMDMMACSMYIEIMDMQIIIMGMDMCNINTMGIMALTSVQVNTFISTTVALVPMLLINSHMQLAGNIRVKQVLV